MNIDFRNEIKSLNVIPINSFGVFVSIKRENIIENYDVHGCIGYWNNDYNNETRELIFEKILDVGYSSTWTDSRAVKMNSIKNILQDSSTLYEIDIMLKPLYNVNQNGILNNNVKFNNIDYGLITEDVKKNKATYLPNVFPNKKWNYIKNRLMSKGSVSGEIHFKAYKIKQYETTLFHFLCNISLIQKKFIEWINVNYTTFIPFSRNGKNKIIIEHTQYVRNIATINNVLQFKNKKRKIIENNLDYYYKEFLSNKDKLRQASSFLILCYNKINNKKYNKQITTIKTFLFSKINELEPKFEKGEVLISLIYTKKNNSENKLFLKQIKNMYNSINNNPKNNIDDIFELNWHSKFVYHLHLNNINYNSNYPKILKLKILNLLKQTQNKEDLETNYLAVFFESLSSIVHLNKNNINIKNNILYLFSLLMKRYKDSLFYFKNNTSRLDITGHVLDGIDALKTKTKMKTKTKIKTKTKTKIKTKKK